MTKETMARPKVSDSGQRELDKAQKHFDDFSESIKNLTLDRMNEAPKEECEPQHKMSQNEIAKSKDIYLKPSKVVSCREKFNEKFREDYEFAKEYVNFIAEHKELIGETIDIWTRPFPGMAAEYWQVPTNKPIWGPRYLAEDIKKRSYHRLKMTDAVTNQEGGMTYYGQMASDTIIQRLDAHPVTKRKSLFMGSKGF